MYFASNISLNSYLCLIIYFAYSNPEHMIIKVDIKIDIHKKGKTNIMNDLSI